MEQLQQTISTVEIADMADVSHRAVIRKLEGREEKGKHIKGIIEVLTDAQMGVSDFFTKSTYVNANNQERPCYKITKKGCKFIAHKLTGIKGTKFTAKYINRFHEMENKIRSSEIANKTKAAVLELSCCLLIFIIVHLS